MFFIPLLFSFENYGKSPQASYIPCVSGTHLGEFLTDGDPKGDLVKSVEELKEHNRNGVEECRRLANHYSKQLFKIYESRDDPFFP